MTEHDYLPGRIVGHEPGAFYNRLAKTLGGYVHEVLAELARQGIVQADAEGQPVVRVCEASAIQGAAQIAVEADMRPIGLAEGTPLRATPAFAGAGSGSQARSISPGGCTPPRWPRRRANGTRRTPPAVS